jgi:CRP-like cAMP-binding protein
VAEASILLDAVPVDERPQAAAALAGCTPHVLPPGATRSAARFADAALLLVESGLVLVLRASASRDVVCGLGAPGSILLPPGPEERLETLTAARVTAVTAAAREALLRLPGAAEFLVLGLADAVRDRQESLAAFAPVRHADRVRDKLLQLARAHGKVVRDGVRLDLPLTHELLGEMVGSARETVTWALAELSREGFVHREGRSYRLAVPPEALAN